MAYEFDKIIDRKGTNCLEYDFARERGHSEEELPLWVADMDFQTAPEIVERLHRSVAHGIFGYSEGKNSYFQALAGWYEKHFGWTVKREWLVKTPGVGFAIAAAVRAFPRQAAKTVKIIRFCNFHGIPQKWSCLKIAKCPNRTKSLRASGAPRSESKSK